MAAVVDVVVDLEWEHPVATPRLPVSWLSDDELAQRLQALQVRRARDTAEEAELIMALAGQRPASCDPAADDPGARASGWAVDAAYDGVNEFFAAELTIHVIAHACGGATDCTILAQPQDDPLVAEPGNGLHTPP